MDDIILSTQNGEPVASSRDVAKRFGKEHKHVLAAIRQLLVAENSATKFFHETEFEYRGQKFPEYLMNRDGFSLLAMGFTGKEAVQWKLKYIEAFNQMENTAPAAFPRGADGAGPYCRPRRAGTQGRSDCRADPEGHLCGCCKRQQEEHPCR